MFSGRYFNVEITQSIHYGFILMFIFFWNVHFFESIQSSRIWFKFKDNEVILNSNILRYFWLFFITSVQATRFKFTFVFFFFINVFSQRLLFRRKCKTFRSFTITIIQCINLKYANYHDFCCFIAFNEIEMLIINLVNMLQ